MMTKQGTAQYEATITAIGVDSTAVREGSCDATISVDGRVVGECTLTMDHEGRLATWGVGMDHWADHQLKLWIAAEHSQHSAWDCDHHGECLVIERQIEDAVTAAYRSRVG